MRLLRTAALWGLLGCTSADTDSIDTDTVDTDAPGDTWDNFAGSFMHTYCVECHTGNGKDFRRYDRVVEFADSSRCGVSPVAEAGCSGSPAPGLFPVGTGPMPTDAERLRFVAWVDDGVIE